LTKARRSPLVYYPSRALSWLVARLWLRLTVEGRDRVPEAGSFLLVCNHQSALDPFLMGIGAGSRVFYVARATLGRLPLVRWWLTSVGTILIEREAPSRQAMERILATLKAGTPVVFFPEGTRSRDGKIGPFRRGLLLLVRKTGATVVPAGLRGSAKALPRGGWFPRPSPCGIRIGPPIPAGEILAPGGLERLRRQVSELSGIPLRALAENGASDQVGEGRSRHSSDDENSSAPNR
jgi:1-acyl-sn-glycerol-3-phosphate acyltransferase